jgi:hypothetical protein
MEMGHWSWEQALEQMALAAAEWELAEVEADM